MQRTTPPTGSASPNTVWPPAAIPGQPGMYRVSDPVIDDDAAVVDRVTGISDRVTGRSDRPPVSDPGQPTGPTEVLDTPVTEGAGLLDELCKAITRYVVMPSPEALNATTLWVAATHLQCAWQHAPRLAVVAPLKQCGKSRLLDLLYESVHAPFITINSTPAAIFRSITEQPPTLLVDEADTLFGSVKVAEKNEEMRGLLNAGHQRNRPTTRVSGPEHKPTKFLTFAMAALAGIGDLPDTIMDRAIVIRMRRRADDEKIQPFRSRRDVPALHELRDRIAAWTSTVVATAAEMEPSLPVEDRAADTWEPLVIVADLAGGHWPATARSACRTMTAYEAGQDAENGLKTRILADIRAVFARCGNPDVLRTVDLISGLCADAEAPWSEYGNGGLSPRGLQILLKDYAINSITVRFTDGQRKGFRRADFIDAWTRYCPRPDAPAPTGP